jgi:hypothetical protein
VQCYTSKIRQRQALFATKPAARTNTPPRAARSRTTSTRRCDRRSRACTRRSPLTLHCKSVSPVLDAPRASTKCPLHNVRREDVVLAAAERWPYLCQEVVQVCSEQAGELGSCGFGAIDNEGHEEERERQELCVEVYDEEADLSRWAVLRERVCVRECERGEEGVAVEDAACESLFAVLATIAS